MSPRVEDWNRRWIAGDIPWDLGGATPALVAWSRGQPAKKQAILVPGCGLGHDAHFLAKRGHRVTAVDFAPQAVAAARTRYPRSRIQWRIVDVNQLPFVNRFDRVWEYTCFCALEPAHRQNYLQKVKAALVEGGIYWGLVFHKPPTPGGGPPFPIDPDDFLEALSQNFQVEAFEPDTSRSVKARAGTEIWFSARKIDDRVLGQPDQVLP